MSVIQISPRFSVCKWEKCSWETMSISARWYFPAPFYQWQKENWFHCREHCHLGNNWNFLYPSPFQLYWHCFCWHSQSIWLRLGHPASTSWEVSLDEFCFVPAVRGSPNDSLWLTLSHSHVSAGFSFTVFQTSLQSHIFKLVAHLLTSLWNFKSLKLPFHLWAHPFWGEQVC